MIVEVDNEKGKIEPKHDKNSKTSQINDTKRFALGNSQIGSFNDVSSDRLVGLSSDPIQPLTFNRPPIVNK